MKLWRQPLLARRRNYMKVNRRQVLSKAIVLCWPGVEMEPSWILRDMLSMKNGKGLGQLTFAHICSHLLTTCSPLAHHLLTFAHICSPLAHIYSHLLTFAPSLLSAIKVPQRNRKNMTNAQKIPTLLFGEIFRFLFIRSSCATFPARQQIWHLLFIIFWMMFVYFLLNHDDILSDNRS